MLADVTQVEARYEAGNIGLAHSCPLLFPWGKHTGFAQNQKENEGYTEHSQIVSIASDKTSLYQPIFLHALDMSTSAISQTANPELESYSNKRFLL